MPNLRSQIVGPLDALGGVYVGKRGLHMVASDGRAFTVTRAEIVANFLSQTGTRPQRKVKTLLWLRQGIRDALGAEQVDVTSVTADIDEDTGEVLGVEVAG